MGTYAGTRRSSCAMNWIKLIFIGGLLSIFIQVSVCEGEPTESECRPYIEKALKEQHLEEIAIGKTDSADFLNEQGGSLPGSELDDPTDSSEQSRESEEVTVNDDDAKNISDDIGDEKTEEAETDEDEKTDNYIKNNHKTENDEDEESSEKGGVEEESEENTDVNDKYNNNNKTDDDDDEDNDDNDNDTAEKMNGSEGDETDKDRDDGDANEEEAKEADDNESSKNDEEEEEEDESLERPIEIEVQEIEIDKDENEEDNEQKESEESNEKDLNEQKESEEDKTEEDNTNEEVEDKNTQEETERHTDIVEEEIHVKKVEEKSSEKEDQHEDETSNETEKEGNKDTNTTDEIDVKIESDAHSEEQSSELLGSIKTMKPKAMPSAESGETEKEKDEPEGIPEEEELTKEMVIPDNLRPRDHIDQILKLDKDSALEKLLEKTIDTTLKSLKSLYENAIKPLEMLYKYKDLSNRHFGDPEIFSKPLILFMGPWSGGKSSTINYLLNNEFSHTSLRTGAEPSPAYFNILMHGEKEEILDGTQLAADWTFSGLQKFGQGLLDRLQGIKLPNKLLEKVNIVEIPGILEIRKQVQRLFPFNDACQWFIDRADIIFLVYDPSKLDVGPETEAILDQLKGREYQTRIILNKADQVKPEELMRVQGTLIWNISPLMSSSEPPIMYSTSLWSMPYEVGAPTRLLLAQERAFLRDLREAIDKRVENKISSARRFAVRVRNHAKMVDCYLTTYYNHKSFFGNRKKISDDIIENPQKYHIYEGLSTLTNISRYDLPDPDVYRDFFKINPLYEFQKLSDTCTYFRGCPINKLDVVIAYDLPELVGKYRKAVEAAKEQLQKENS